jgi:hypothetical protein
MGSIIKLRVKWKYSSRNISVTSTPHQRRTRIRPPHAIATAERQIDSLQREMLAHQCRVLFDRISPQLMTSHYNWHIAVDPETEKYLIAPTLIEITQQIKNTYPDPASVKLTIFRLNETGACGRL